MNNQTENQERKKQKNDTDFNVENLKKEKPRGVHKLQKNHYKMRGTKRSVKAIR